MCASTLSEPPGSSLARLALITYPSLHARLAVRVQARLLGARDEPVQKQALTAGPGGPGGSSKELSGQLSGRFGPVLRLLLLAIDPAAWRLVHKLSASPAGQPAAGALTLMAQSALQGAMAAMVASCSSFVLAMHMQVHMHPLRRTPLQAYCTSHCMHTCTCTASCWRCRRCDVSIDSVWVQCMCSACAVYVHAQLDPALLGAIIKVATKPLLAGPQPAAEVAQSLVFQLLAVPALAARRDGATCRAGPQRAPPEEPG